MSARAFNEVFGRLLGAIEDADRQIARLHARQARLVEAARALRTPREEVLHRPGGWNSGVIAHRELVFELACLMRLPERTAEALIARSCTLVESLPATLAAMSRGEVGPRQVQVIVEHAWALPEQSHPAFEAELLPVARTATAAKLDRRARVVRERLHPDSLTERAKAAREERDVSFQPGRDGMAWLNSYLPAEVALAAYNRATDIAASLKDGAETRTLAQLRADVVGDLLIDGVTQAQPDPSMSPEDLQQLEVLRSMALSVEELTGESISLEELAAETETDLPSLTGVRPAAVPHGTGYGIRAEVLVTVPVLSLLGHDDEPASLEGYGPIDPDTARRIAADAPSFHRILTHPETGAVLSVGRNSYAVPKDLRRWLRVRDGTCRAPGCNRAARKSELDHTLDWQYNGLTEHDNLAHLCSSAHRLKHQTSVRVVQGPDGELDWITPSGRHYPTEPEVRMRPAPTFE